MIQPEVLANSIGLYVHFPWCVAKCPYCDFNSHPLKGTLAEEDYVAALLVDLHAALAELDRWNAEPRLIDSVFFGGGTPSLFRPASFERLLLALDGRLTANAEVTMEANPGTLEHGDFSGYRSAGINRLSLGAQSFDDKMLQALGRIHNSANTYRAFDLARSAGFSRINLDLMYALPKQTAVAAERDLNDALALEPDHLSWYQLTLEPRTEFYRKPPPLPGETQIEQVEKQGRTRLKEAGYSRYEISAYARPNQASRHNLNYWTFGDYLGVGAGAHGKLRRDTHSVRTRKARQPRLYLADPLQTQLEPVATSALPAEFAMNALRLEAGVSADCYQQRTGQADTELLEPWQRLTELGLMRADRFAATPKGYELLDSLIAEFL